MRDGVVVNIVVADGSDRELADGSLLVPSGTAQIGDVLVDGALVPRSAGEVTLPAARGAAYSNVKNWREQQELSGVFLNGMQFHTDMASQIKYLGVMQTAMTDPDYRVPFKTASGEYVVLHNDLILGVCSGIRRYVQSCYEAEAYFNARIAGAPDVASVKAVDPHSCNLLNSYPVTGVAAPSYLATKVLVNSNLRVAGHAALNDVAASNLSVAGCATLGKLSACNLAIKGLYSGGAQAFNGLVWTGEARVKDGRATVAPAAPGGGPLFRAVMSAHATPVSSGTTMALCAIQSVSPAAITFSVVDAANGLTPAPDDTAVLVTVIGA